MTTRVRLGTNILLAALRRPVVLAKTAATLDVLSGGRLDLGVGVGWQREEYEAAGLDFDAAGRLLDHTLEVCQTLWREQRASFDADRSSASRRSTRCRSRVQPGGVPIWVSGTRETARRPPARPLRQRLDPVGRRRRRSRGRDPRMRAEVDAAGGDGTHFAVLAPLLLHRHPNGSLDLQTTMRDLPRLVEAGVTDFLAHLRAPDSYEGARGAYSEIATGSSTPREDKAGPAASASGGN